MDASVELAITPAKPTLQMSSSIAFRLLLLVLLAAVTGRWTGEAAAQLPPAGDPPYVPTPMTLVNQMLDLAGVGEGDVLYDLGSGDGRIVIAAAERGAEAVGIEYEGWLVRRSWENADSAGVLDSVSFAEQDVFETDVSDASVVMLYLGSDFNIRLRPRLLAQLRPGARIVSHAFHMDEWEPDRTQTIGSGAGRATLFYWVVPADVDGFWSLEIDGSQPMVLELNQAFQKIEGEVAGGGRRWTVSEGSLRGEAIRFRLAAGEDEMTFTGRVDQGRISGTINIAGETRRWRATRFTDASRAPS